VHCSVQLDSRQPSFTEVLMRWIGLAVVLILGLILAPLAGEAQRAGKVWRIGFLAATPQPYLSKAFSLGLRDLGGSKDRTSLSNIGMQVDDSNAFPISRLNSSVSTST